ncbi:AraC-like DNA-binding protein/mannose-6-phosphate isomerase-like protein (cupin superfamily) [Paenibacillus castaneae]|uniref:helix-turn-helix transcriptional regulator n=1 Tax=Paenibacillus castaneae TaxID=474957 RepID=UPI00141B0E3D|nr:AraC family transcriptional regulator [Paenibacillus castaneae]NIK78724.1 AraC-like DNA-binding protein/mannose-6-phosphate isomerase-like protein (cupin superfamily) [Paenibacillus castaneae]
MEWNHLFTEGAVTLNQEAFQVNGSDASILIHYWGAQPDHYNNKPHQHSFFELCYIIDGKGMYIDNAHSFQLTSGSLFLSRPFVIHQILSENGLKIIYVGFEIIQKDSTKKLVELFKTLERTEIFFINDADQTPVVNLWTSILVIACNPHLMFNDSFQGLCSSFYSSIVGLFHDQQTKQQKNKDIRLYSSLVYQAKLYIHDNLSQSLQMSDVANYIHISKRHLSRIFQNELGQSFANYIKKERMRKAGILLSDTDLTLKEISELLGFKTVHYFTTVFSAEMGMPPGEFKRKFHQQTLI